MIEPLGFTELREFTLLRAKGFALLGWTNILKYTEKFIVSLLSRKLDYGGIGLLLLVTLVYHLSYFLIVSIL